MTPNRRQWRARIARARCWYHDQPTAALSTAYVRVCPLGCVFPETVRQTWLAKEGIRDRSCR